MAVCFAWASNSPRGPFMVSLALFGVAVVGCSCAWPQPRDPSVLLTHRQRNRLEAQQEAQRVEDATTCKSYVSVLGSVLNRKCDIPALFLILSLSFFLCIYLCPPLGDWSSTLIPVVFTSRHVLTPTRIRTHTHTHTQNTMVNSHRVLLFHGLCLASAVRGVHILAGSLVDSNSVQGVCYLSPGGWGSLRPKSTE